MIPLGYRGRRVRVLISQHRDGELVCRVIKRFGFEAVRGSTTRGGHAALRQLVHWGRQGADLAVTPDGPRGPRCRVQPGVRGPRQTHGHTHPSVDVCMFKKKTFSIWDRFIVPYPFSRGVFIWGHPIWVDRHRRCCGRRTNTPGIGNDSFVPVLQSPKPRVMMPMASLFRLTTDLTIPDVSALKTGDLAFFLEGRPCGTQCITSSCSSGLP